MFSVECIVFRNMCYFPRGARRQELVTAPRFTDAARLHSLVAAGNASMMNTLQESGHAFARSYAAAVFSERLALADRLSSSDAKGPTARNARPS